MKVETIRCKCPSCNEKTILEIFSMHERDSSNDYIKCTSCKEMFIVDTYEYNYVFEEGI